MTSQPAVTLSHVIRDVRTGCAGPGDSVIAAAGAGVAAMNAVRRAGMSGRIMACLGFLRDVAG